MNRPVFTGLVQDLGEVVAVEATDAGATLTIATALAGDVGLGDSVAVNGVCLTATTAGDGRFVAYAINETLRHTSLGALEPGAAVNLELALRADARLGGHVMQGHVDGVGTLREVREDGVSRVVRVAADPELLRYVVHKGSIALDGVSLTVSAIGEDWLEVSLIPETLERTTLGRNDTVNVEVDVMAKYVEKLVAPYGGLR